MAQRYDAPRRLPGPDLLAARVIVGLRRRDRVRGARPVGRPMTGRRRSLRARSHIASVVLTMGPGSGLAQRSSVWLPTNLRRQDIPSTPFGLACALFSGLQATVLDRLPLPTWPQWSTIASFGNMTVLSSSIMGEL
jgi:hypothetical protein